MRQKILIILFLLITGSSASGSETDKKEKVPAADIGSENIIAIMPFYNYSGSGMKYLSTYIPELIKDSIPPEGDIMVMDAEEVISEAESKGIKVDRLYDVEYARQLLPVLRAGTLIIGRYIVQDKNLRIDYRAVTGTSRRPVEGKTADIVIDDHFLPALARFSESVNTWVRTFILKEDYFKADKEKENLFVMLFNRVKGSKAGIIVKNRWIFSLLILLFFYIVSKIVVLFFEKVLVKLTEKTSFTMDEEIVDVSKKPAKWIVIIFGIKLAVFSLKLSPEMNLQLANISTAVIILLVTYILSNIVVIIIRSWGHKVASKLDSRIDNDLVPLFVKVSKVVVFSIGVIMVLSRFNVDIAPLIASLGIAGFAIGFAVKDSLANIIGGIVLILDQSFAVGDRVTIDGDTGVIKEVGLRNTKIQTFDNEIIVIPNGDLMNKKFKNSVLPDPTIRVIVEFTVSYGTDVEKVEEVVMKAIKGISDIADDPPPAVVFYEMGDFSLKFQAKFWVPDYVYQYGKWVEATRLVYNTLNREGISIPFPTHPVFLEKGEV